MGEKSFTISGSMPYPSLELRNALETLFIKNNIPVEKGYQLYVENLAERNDWALPQKTIMTHFSPPLDSLNYWFLKKSINLYGEALIKTIAYEKTGLGSTEKGVELVKDFWSKQGIEPSAFNIIDGSGLSPQNWVTADALVRALQYASSRSWFHSFYSALPEINGMKMKGGSIGGVKSFTGYQAAKDGREYIFAIMVNNYNGPPSVLVKKIWELLGLLK